MFLVASCGGNTFFFDYHQFDTGGDCTRATWNYLKFSCTPITYTIQGFSFEDVLSETFKRPRVEFQAASSTAIIPSDHFINEAPVYFRLVGFNAAHEVCATTDFYNFTYTFDNGELYTWTRYRFVSFIIT